MYIWLSQIPLFAVTLFVGFCFTMPLWASHSTIQSDNNAHFAIGSKLLHDFLFLYDLEIKNLEDQQLWMGQCELDVRMCLVKSAMIFLESGKQTV